MEEKQVKRYISCKWLESGVCFDNGVYGSNIKLCCYLSAPGGGNTMIFEDYRGYTYTFWKKKNGNKKII